MGYAFESSQSSKIEAPFVEQIMTNEQGVHLLIGEYWLNADGLQASENGMFVLLHGEWMPLSEAVKMRGYLLRSWKCSRCGRYNLEGINACAYCGKPKNG